jgi:hypothetical protein
VSAILFYFGESVIVLSPDEARHEHYASGSAVGKYLPWPYHEDTGLGWPALERGALVPVLRGPRMPTAPYWWKSRRIPMPTQEPDDHAQSYLQAQGVVPRHLKFGGRTAPFAWKARRIPMRPPLPQPETQRALLGDPVPDRGQSFAWPHPEFKRPE